VKGSLEQVLASLAIHATTAVRTYMRQGIGNHAMRPPSPTKLRRAATGRPFRVGLREWLASPFVSHAATSQTGPDSNLQHPNAESLRGISVGDARNWVSRRATLLTRPGRDGPAPGAHANVGPTASLVEIAKRSPVEGKKNTDSSPAARDTRGIPELPRPWSVCQGQPS
jgi:hypothetical protein